MNELLLSLRVLSKMQANERIGRRVDGILTIERSNNLLSTIGRSLRGDSRALSMRELDRIVTHAREKATDLIYSRHVDSDHTRSRLLSLEGNLRAAIDGLRALQQTYGSDANIVAFIDQIVARIHEVTCDIRATLED